MKADNDTIRPDWELIGKYVSGEDNHIETEQIKEWADCSEQNQHELEQILLLIHHIDNFYLPENHNTNSAWEKVRSKISTRVSETKSTPINNRFQFAFYKYAAVITLLTLTAISVYQNFMNLTINHEPTELIYTGSKEIIEQILPDGSVVTLNAQTMLRYPLQFKGKQRTVEVTGEAYFDIEPDPDNPFIIEAGNAQITVLGTAFNVKAYPDGPAIEVTVESGKVQVSCSSINDEQSDSQIELHSGEQGIVSGNNSKIKKTKFSDVNYLAWKTRTLSFHNTPLNEVVQQLEKVYHMHIELEEKELSE